MPRPYDRRRWKFLRVQIGLRDSWRCQVPEGDTICGAPARELDHIRPLSKGGSWFDPSNLRMACAHHQRLQGGRLGAAASGWVVPSMKPEPCPCRDGGGGSGRGPEPSAPSESVPAVKTGFGGGPRDEALVEPGAHGVSSFAQDKQGSRRARLALNL
jgi:hypothetical protein